LSRRRFVIVQYPDFQDNGVPTLEYLPSTWVFIQNGLHFCNYPSGLSSEQITEMADKRTDLSGCATDVWKINVLSSRKKLEHVKERFEQYLRNEPLEKSVTETEDGDDEEEGGIAKPAQKKRKRLNEEEQSPLPPIFAAAQHTPQPGKDQGKCMLLGNTKN